MLCVITHRQYRGRTVSWGKKQNKACKIMNGEMFIMCVNLHHQQSLYADRAFNRHFHRYKNKPYGIY